MSRAIGKHDRIWSNGAPRGGGDAHAIACGAGRAAGQNRQRATGEPRGLKNNK